MADFPIIYSRNRVLFEEIIKGKDITEEDERILDRLVESFDDMPTVIVENLRREIMIVHDSLEGWLPIELYNWDFLPDRPKNVNPRDFGFVQEFYDSIFAHKVGDMTKSLVSYMIESQSHVLKYAPCLYLAKAYVSHLKSKISKLELKLKEPEKYSKFEEETKKELENQNKEDLFDLKRELDLDESPTFSETTNEFEQPENSEEKKCLHKIMKTKISKTKNTVIFYCEDCGETIKEIQRGEKSG